MVLSFLRSIRCSLQFCHFRILKNRGLAIFICYFLKLLDLLLMQGYKILMRNDLRRSGLIMESPHSVITLRKQEMMLMPVVGVWVVQALRPLPGHWL